MLWWWPFLRLVLPCSYWIISKQLPWPSVWTSLSGDASWARLPHHCCQLHLFLIVGLPLALTTLCLLWSSSLIMSVQVASLLPQRSTSCPHLCLVCLNHLHWLSLRTFKSETFWICPACGAFDSKFQLHANFDSGEKYNMVKWFMWKDFNMIQGEMVAHGYEPVSGITLSQALSGLLKLSSYLCA